MKYLLTEARKALIAATTGVAAVLSAGLLHGTAQIVATALVAVVGTVGVHQVGNQ